MSNNLHEFFVFFRLFLAKNGEPLPFLFAQEKKNRVPSTIQKQTRSFLFFKYPAFLIIQPFSTALTVFHSTIIVRVVPSEKNKLILFSKHSTSAMISSRNITATYSASFSAVIRLYLLFVLVYMIHNHKSSK